MTSSSQINYVCAYFLTLVLREYISYAHLSLIKDESVDPTHLLIIPYALSFLLNRLIDYEHQTVVLQDIYI